MRILTKKWFTLAELTIVITILSILATLSFPLLTWYEAVSERKTVNTAFMTTIQEINSKAIADWQVIKWKLSSNIICDYWVICKLHSSTELAWFANFWVDEEWYYIHWKDKENIYYVTSNDWETVWLWTITKLYKQWRITKAALITTNDSRNVNVETAFWILNWAEWVQFVWSEISDDTNWNWIIEISEASSKTDL